VFSFRQVAGLVATTIRRKVLIGSGLLGVVLSAPLFLFGVDYIGGARRLRMCELVGGCFRCSVFSVSVLYSGLAVLMANPTGWRVVTGRVDVSIQPGEYIWCFFSSFMFPAY
jgi:hypothetical protein